MKNNLNSWAGIAVLIVAALLYLTTLDNGLRPDELTGGDLITHQYAQVEARPSNAPGYPLYIMGGWLWFRLGRVMLGWILNPVQILSLYSTLYALASLLVLYLLLLRAGGQWTVSFLLTAFYSTTFFFWYYSVTTEQYTSAVFQTVLLIWLAFKWDDTPQDSTLLWLAFISGTMLANMVTTLFVLPPLLWFIFFKREAEDGHNFFLRRYLKNHTLIVKAIVAAFLPVFSYSYIYIRGMQHPEWRGVGEWTDAWSWFIQFVTIQQGRDELAPGLTGQHFFTDEFPSLMWHELTLPVFLGGLFGLIFLGRRRAVFLYSVLAIYLLFSWGYRFGNWFQVIIPAYPIFIIGFAALIKRIQPLSLAINRAVIFLLGILLIYRFSTNLPQANQHNLPTDTGLNPGWAILADSPAVPAVISVNFEEKVALQYLSVIWQIAPLIYPTNPGNFDLPPGVEGQVYISRNAAATSPDIFQAGDIYPQSAGQQLIALYTSPRLLPPGVISLDITYGDGLKLVGWEQVDTDTNWQIALYWQSTQQINRDYTISVRPLVGGQLISVGGENMIQDHKPVWGFYPTNRWRSGEVVRDVYALSLPEDVKPESVQIVVYTATANGFENLGESIIIMDSGQ